MNALTTICLLSSIAGLALIYVAALGIEPQQTKIGDINFELVGRVVSTTGYISYKSSHPNGHIFLILKDGKAKIQVPLFAGYLNSLVENGLSANDFRKGTKLAVEGLVEEYRGSLQIIPRKPDDIRILS